MHKIAVVSHGMTTSLNIAADLEGIFGRYAKISAYAATDQPLLDEETLVVFTGKYGREELLRRVQVDSQMIIARRAINQRNLKKLLKIPIGAKVLLVNDHPVSAQLALDQLEDLGFDQWQVDLYWPGKSHWPQRDIVITPGEAHLVPKGSGDIIDIGTRQIDITTLIEIATALGIDGEIGGTLSAQYVRDVVDLLHESHGNQLVADRLYMGFRALANHSSEGILLCDGDLRVQVANEVALTMLGQESDGIVGQAIQGLIPGVAVHGHNKGKDKGQLIKVNGREFYQRVRLIQQENRVTGAVVTLEDPGLIRQMAHEIRRKKRAHTHTAKYSFEDILYRDKAMEGVLDRAKRLANREGTVLIEGESGTGKELLAQAIHTGSDRKTGPFVPVNFAALPESLLESELFGYEEGAFTGARKKGKAGLFEEAHGGTLFLDEIGDAPLTFQARLLRVLQEGEVRRVGGVDQIPVDVRVIVATHRDLEKEVDQGHFRADLFYRISVLPIELPALRDRGQDVLLLLKSFLKEVSGVQVEVLDQWMTPPLQDWVVAFPWEGNIRQLQNFAMYVALEKDQEPLDLGDLSSRWTKGERRGGQTPHDQTLGVLKEALGKELVWLLEALYREGAAGRRYLSQMAKADGFAITEAQLRRLLVSGESMGLVEIRSGRAGSQLTQKGIGLMGAITGG